MLVFYVRTSVSSREVGTENLPGNLGFGNFPFPGKFMSGSREIFFIRKDFRGTDIYHSDIKNALLQIKNFFLLTKNYFSKFANFFNTKC